MHDKVHLNGEPLKPTSFGELFANYESDELDDELNSLGADGGERDKLLGDEIELSNLVMASSGTHQVLRRPSSALGLNGATSGEQPAVINHSEVNLHVAQDKNRSASPKPSRKMP